MGGERLLEVVYMIKYTTCGEISKIAPTVQLIEANKMCVCVKNLLMGLVMEFGTLVGVH
jgi:hypothetical protein